MTPAEFQAWIEVYRATPFDDYHRYHRPAALISVSLGGGDVGTRLEWLQPEAAPAELSEVDQSFLKAFGITGKAG